MAIRILDAQTIGRIAAGEVVGRPASVVKELMENAIDAGSSSVTVELRDGGAGYLRVTDNGCGIAAEEIRTAFENHATSKLRCAEDLNDIRTLGFRGEALPSIAAVSKLEITTRTRGAQSGVTAKLEGGRFLSVSEAGCPEGTTIVVKDLFFNTPPRRAFLKKPAYEGGLVIETVTRLMLGNPGVAVRLVSGGRTLFHSFGDGSFLHAALAVYGRETAEKLIPVDVSEGAVRVRGLVGVEDCARANRSQQAFFINGRLVSCLLLTRALEKACAGRVTIGMHPLCALSISLPAGLVDVNVHPNKLEIRFRDEESFALTAEKLFSGIFPDKSMLELGPASPAPAAPQPPAQREPAPRELSEQLRIEVLAPAAEKAYPPREEASPAREGTPAPEAEALTPVRVRLPGPAGALRESGAAFAPSEAPAPKPAEAPRAAEKPEPRRAETPYRVIGAAFDTYLLVESGEELLLIDQHAAHERILYERFSERTGIEAASQQLLTPLLFSVTEAERQKIEDNEALIRSAGFDFELFGQRDIRVRALPFILGQTALRPLFLEMLDRLDQLKYQTEEKKRRELIQTACKHAVKAGDRLSPGEIAELIETMRLTNAPATCPHGRPVVRRFTKTELEKLFKRIQ